MRQNITINKRWRLFMILFRCDSVYQLMNAIQIKITLLKDEAADLLLSDHTNFDSLIPSLQESGIFEEVKRLYSKKKADEYWTYSKEERKNISKDPQKYVDMDVLDKEYTEFYISFETAYAKLMYYAMVKKGMHPKVHLFEDGMATYVCDVKKRCMEDGMDHAFYKEDQFIDNIERLLLYDPALFIGEKMPFPIEKIPTIDYKNKEVKDVFHHIFGEAKLPKQKFIFLEEAFFDDKIPSNDLELVLRIAEIVGKDQMIIKLHPRNKVNRFQEYGFQTMQHTQVPWEITLMDEDITDKILFTISSNASITSKLIFEKNMNVVMLYRMFTGKTWLMGNANFSLYHERSLKEFNKDRKNIYCPYSFDEMKEILKYIEGVSKIERMS